MAVAEVEPLAVEADTPTAADAPPVIPHERTTEIDMAVEKDTGWCLAMARRAHEAGVHRGKGSIWTIEIERANATETESAMAIETGTTTVTGIAMGIDTVTIVIAIGIITTTETADAEPSWFLGSMHCMPYRYTRL